VAQPGISTLAHALHGYSKVTATSILDDQLFVSHEFAEYVSVYNTTSFLLQRQLIIPGLGSYVLGLAACATNNVLYVSDNTGICVHKVDLSITSGDIVVSKWRVANRPRRLSINRAHNVLVACNVGVEEYDPSGSLVRAISNGNYVFQAVELSSGMLAISRTEPVYSVATMSMDGQVIKSYGDQEGSGLGQMSEPAGIAVDSDGYIFVADFYKHQILVVNPSLTESRHLPLPANTDLRYPIAVSLDQSRGRLYVGECGGQRRVLIFDNVINTRALLIS
jgi:DNA-binding beta-propeller fold protein YncE